MNSTNPGVAVGGRVYIGNQGTVRVATVIKEGRSRVTIKWKNSVREMTRDVNIVYGLAEWLNGDTSAYALPAFACSPREQAHLNTEPRIRAALPVPEVRA